MKILLITEDEVSYEVLNEVASLSDSKVIWLKSLAEAKEFLNVNKDIHAVIASEKLSDGPSLHILAIVKKDPSMLGIPFVMIANEPTQEEIEYYKTLGVAEVFETPFNPLEIFLVITNYIKDTKGEEVVKEILEEPKKEKKSILAKIIEFFKKIFGKG
ncbi:MAG: histidine kinase [Hydrogenothermaceae bacterium]|nr:histidine kinase [Hydrogenothermaceae bacterium]